MLSSSKSDKNDSKQEVRFAARIDVLMERVDTLAATVATTASATAKRDGEIASLRRELQARDDALQQLVVQARAGSPAADDGKLRALEDTVAAMASERSKAGSSKQLEEVTQKVGLLGQRLETLSTTVSTTAAGMAAREGELATIRKRLESGPAAVAGGTTADPALKQQLVDLSASIASMKLFIDEQAAELAALKTQAERQAAEPDRPSEELSSMLAALRTQVEALNGLKTGVSDEQLDERLAGTDSALAVLSERIDGLSRSVESAAANLADKEHELSALHRHFTESSARIEAVVDDIREALSAFPDMGSSAVEELATRVELMESATREASEARSKGADDLAHRIDVIDRRVATVATEVARAKTLWPVALRSLEARLDDAVSHAHRDEAESPTSTDDTTSKTDDHGDSSDDLLAGLRDSLHAMETVAAEMARASDALSSTDDEETGVDEAAPVASAGATIVPLRTGEP
jgi:chromosome segregation ATPase